MDKICVNGEYIQKDSFSLSFNNRSFKYGDSFFETILCVSGKPLFWEEHYFRIAASFLVLKMDPPSNFDINKFKNIIKEILIKNNLTKDNARVRISFFRDSNGYYLPNSNCVGYIINSELLKQPLFELNKKGLVLGFYKENYLYPNTLSNFKTNNRLLNVLSSIYAKENKYDDVILLNHKKQIVESTKGNIFIIDRDDHIYTPSLDDGCIDGIMRRIIIKELGSQVKEVPVSISDFINAKEIFITNVIIGVNWIQQVNDIDKYSCNISSKILDMISSKYLV